MLHPTLKVNYSSRKGAYVCYAFCMMYKTVVSIQCKGWGVLIIKFKMLIIFESVYSFRQRPNV